jgi:hypothetical protein
MKVMQRRERMAICHGETNTNTCKKILTGFILEQEDEAEKRMS